MKRSLLKMKKKALNKLIKLLDLETLEENLFRGQSENIGGPRVFGGQVIGQALTAAARTVPEKRFAHSLHAYFLRPGDMEYPIIYNVERTRDGGSFTTRRVVAIQKGEPIFDMALSFHKKEKGPSHQIDMGDIPGPNECLSELDIKKKIIDNLVEQKKNIIDTIYRESVETKLPENKKNIYTHYKTNIESPESEAIEEIKRKTECIILNEPPKESYSK